MEARFLGKFDETVLCTTNANVCAQLEKKCVMLEHNFSFVYIFYEWIDDLVSWLLINFVSSAKSTNKFPTLLM